MEAKDRRKEQERGRLWGRGGGEIKRIWKSSAHHFSQEIASLFESLPESVPPVETALQMLFLYSDYKEGALYEENIYFGPQRFRAAAAALGE